VESGPSATCPSQSLARSCPVRASRPSSAAPMTWRALRFTPSGGIVRRQSSTGSCRGKCLLLWCSRCLELQL
ncbi:hypothetical protein O3G_MSEX000666, partial [Manduca sexta]